VETVSLHEAAARLGVHYMTAYRYVRHGRLAATKVAGEWRVARKDLDEFEADPTPARRRKAPWHERMHERLLASDEAGAWGVVESALAAGMEPGRVYVDVLAPAMKTIGDEWESGRVSIADEHRASAVAVRLIGRLGPRFARKGRSRGHVAVAGAPGERHAIPLSMLGDLLRGAGFEVTDLGPDVPAEALADVAIDLDRLTAVCISATNHAADAKLRKAVAAVKKAVDVPVFVGGAAIIGSEHARRLGADGWAADGLGAVALVESVLGS
jgi:excisionase family DNA binding protein